MTETGGPFAGMVQNIFEAKDVSINDRVLMVLLTALYATSSRVFPQILALLAWA